MMASLFEELKTSWRSLIKGLPGKRFLRHHERAQREPSVFKTVLRVGGGLVLVVVGILLWFLPGPGWLFVILGLALFAGEWRFVACWLDRAEVSLRRQMDRLR